MPTLQEVDREVDAGTTDTIREGTMDLTIHPAPTRPRARVDYRAQLWSYTSDESAAEEEDNIKPRLSLTSADQREAYIEQRKEHYKDYINGSLSVETLERSLQGELWHITQQNALYAWIDDAAVFDADAGFFGAGGAGQTCGICLELVLHVEASF